MNAKYVLALVLALQVSMSLCEIPQPSPELVDKYNSLKEVFIRRLLKSYERIQGATGPLLEGAGQGEQGQRARDYVEGLQSKPGFQNFVKVMASLGKEASPLVEKARLAGLGAYEEYVRPNWGTTLDEFINNLKPILDTYMPAE